MSTTVETAAAIGPFHVDFPEELDKGGNFAAWEEPELFSEELRGAFAPVR
jgi:hypothetical protein